MGRSTSATVSRQLVVVMTSLALAISPLRADPPAGQQGGQVTDDAGNGAGPGGGKQGKQKNKKNNQKGDAGDNQKGEAAAGAGKGKNKDKSKAKEKGGNVEAPAAGAGPQGGQSGGGNLSKKERKALKKEKLQEKKQKQDDTERTRSVAPEGGGAPDGATGKPSQSTDTPAVQPDTSGKGGEKASEKGSQKFKAPSRDVIKKTYVEPPKSKLKVQDVQKTRKESVADGGKVKVIEEVDKRTIIRKEKTVIIRHDESERFVRVSRDAKTIRRSDGSFETVIVRDNGMRVYNVVNKNGTLLYRYRRDPFGREVILIDNRPYYRDRGISASDLALGVGVGLLVAATIVALAPPAITIPREKYIVDYGRASDDDIYEALTAPPVERLGRVYSLDEIRYNESLRERVRRVDLDTVTFDFGSWDVTPDQYQTLARIAGGINRALERDPDQIFMIEGHTDAVGSEEDNLSLSDRRAQSVAEVLTAEFGVPPENLVTQGYGEEFLKVPTEGPERANRRIVVRNITYLMSERDQR